ncbi:MAG: type 1 glutamine amidotransferase [Prolixibacteraceae bacterium]|nr:type 1 glutamine amidotransferase [Prolixibacteraceae bacterium]
MRIHYIQHVAHEGLGYIGEWAEQNNHPVTVTKLYEGEPFPEMSDFDLLVVLGGPMSVHDDDKIPWLQDEKSFVVHAITDGKKVLGICLGAQLVAHLLGAEIKKSPNTEIGWFPVKKTTQHTMFADLPDEFTAFHWHGEMFDIPAGAERIFGSEGCDNQGFIYYDEIIGVQFHFETTPEAIEEMLANETIVATDENYVQRAEEIQTKKEYTKAINGYLATILERLTA